MGDDHPKSEPSSTQTNYSTSDQFDLFTSSTDEIAEVSTKNSASSSTVETSPGNINDDWSKMSSDDSAAKRVTTTEDSSDFVAGTSTSTIETRISTTASETEAKTTESEPKTTETEYGSARKTTSCSDNSDSAYTNSRSNLTYSSRENTVDSHSKMEDRTEILGRAQNESSTQTPNAANLNVISNIQLSQSTLNVIFNHVLQDVNSKQFSSFNLSAMSASLLQDENKENEGDRMESETRDPKIINVQPVPSFYLNRKEDVVVTSEHSRVIKYMISNVGTGSPYSKPAEVPQVIVPRFSALPRTSSMEVNTSSVDSTDKESDSVSLVDSLEDGVSPNRIVRDILAPVEDNPVKSDDLSTLLPDNSDKKIGRLQKSALFFIPIESKPKEEDLKPVSYHLPARVKEKLSRRQLKRERKLQQSKSNYTSPRSDSNYISASDNQISFSINNKADGLDVKSMPLFPEINANHKSRRKSRAILPSIQNIRKIQIDSKDNIKYTECEKIRDRFNKPIKRKSITKYEKVKNDHPKQPSWTTTTKGFHKIPEKLAPIYTSRDEYTCETLPKEIYRKTEFGNSSKRIEILQITECVDRKAKPDFPQKAKSKIPVLIQPKLPKIERKTSIAASKPIYLDLDRSQEYDSKMDQLIANILIDTLNKYENSALSPSNDSKRNLFKSSDEKRPDEDVKLINNHKFQQKFDAIPEESNSRHSSLDETSTGKSEKNLDVTADILTRNVLKNNNLYNDDSTKSEDRGISPGKLGDVLTIPQGWITFYMLHKNRGSPDSTSDEGTKVRKNVREDDNFSKQEISNDRRKEFNNKSEKLLETSDFLTVNNKDKSRRDTLDTILSSEAFSDNLNTALPHANNEQSSKQFSYQNTNVSNNNNNTRYSISDQCPPQGWSVTVSGINTYGQFAPDVEMRLKFPTSKENVDFSSQTKDGVEDLGSNSSYCFPTERSCQLVKRHNHGSMSSVMGVTAADDSFRSGRLPIINQNSKSSQQIDLNLTNSVVPFGFDPRQTKTSMRRYALTRHRTLPSTDANVTAENILNLSTETGMFRKFSEMAVNGNSILPEEKTNCVYANPR